MGTDLIIWMIQQNYEQGFIEMTHYVPAHKLNLNYWD